MTSGDRDAHLDAELDATLAAMTASGDIEARSRARVLAALDRDREPSGWWRTRSLQALAAGVVLLMAIAAGMVWNRSSSGNEARPEPPAVASRVAPTAPIAPPIRGAGANRVEATGVAHVRRPRRPPPGSSWEGELPRLEVPLLQRPAAIAAEQMTIDDVTISPIPIAGIEIEAVDASVLPSPHP